MKRAFHFFIDGALLLLAIFAGYSAYQVVSADVQIVRVVSDSMAPTIHRGDSLIFKSQKTVDIDEGEILLLPLADESGASYVHRVIEKKMVKNSAVEVVTKGDANPVIDDWRITITSTKVPVYVATLPTRDLPLFSAGEVGLIAFVISLLFLGASFVWPKIKAKAERKINA